MVAGIWGAGRSYFWLNDGVVVWPGHCNPVISLSVSLCRSLTTWVKSGDCWSTGSELKGWIDTPGVYLFVDMFIGYFLKQVFVIHWNHVYLILERKMWSVMIIRILQIIYKVSQTWTMAWNVHGWHKTFIHHGHSWFLSKNLPSIETFSSKLPLKFRYRLS